MKKKIIFAATLLILIAMGVFVIRILSWKKELDENRRAILQEEAMVLKDVSKRTGRVFNDWLPLREYVFCNLLKAGMTHEEIYTALSTVGDVRFEDDQADYKNEYLNWYLSPIIMKFTYEYPKRLTYWSGSSEANLSAPMASYENERK